MNNLILIILSIIILIIVYLIYISGIFETIKEDNSSFPELKVIYYTFIGHYPTAWKKYPTLLKEIKEKYNVDFTMRPAFGIYYDDPSKVEESKLRSVVGLVLPDDFQDIELPGYQIGYIPQIKESVTLTLSCKGFL